MQKNIHPDYHEITVQLTDGSKFQTKSTYGKAGDTLKLDIDTKTHPAWVGGTAFLNENVSKVAKFKEKFGAISLDMGSKKAAPAPVPSAPKQEAPKEKAPAAPVEAKPEAAQAAPVEEVKPAEEVKQEAAPVAEEAPAKEAAETAPEAPAGNSEGK